MHLIATPQMALEAAANVARDAGYAAHILGDAIEGEARDVGKVLAALARQVAQHGAPFKTPCVLISGGETTVTVQGEQATFDGSFVIKRADFAIGEGDWADFSVVANEIQVKFKVLASGGK